MIVKGTVAKLTGRMKGKAQEPKAEEEKPEDESDDGEEEGRAKNLGRRRNKANRLVKISEG